MPKRGASPRRAGRRGTASGRAVSDGTSTHGRTASDGTSTHGRNASPDAFSRLWSPWRMEYIHKAAAPKGCLFCRVAASKADRANFVVARHGTALVMLNRFPYNPAHLMVAPLRHVAGFGGLTAAERADLLELTARAEAALGREYRPDGMNVGANLGRVAGAGFPGHLHLHLVPRWNGDTNFMPTIGGTRVLPESLARTWSRIRRALGGARGPK